MVGGSIRRRAGRAGIVAVGWVVATVLSLAGCTAPSPQHRVAFRQDGPLVPPDLMIPESDGVSLPARLWIPPAGEPARAVVVALHGFGDSRDAWDRVGPLFAAQGVALLAYDARGFGAAPGRGSWAGTDRMEADIVGAAATASGLFPDAPLYLMGESMGGAELIVLAAGDRLARARIPTAGTILLAPAVWGRDAMNPAAVLALDTADLVAPGWTLTGREIPLHVEASDDRAALIRLARDPLTLRGASVSMLAGLVDLMTQAARDAPRMRGAVLIATGAHDQLVPPRATAAAWLRLGPDVRRAYYANGWHLMMRDLDRRAVEADVLSWIATPERPLPSGADVLAAAWLAGRSWQDEAPLPLPAAALGGLTDRDTGADPAP